LPKPDPALPDRVIEKFYSSCKECGVKVTHQRLEIYREIAAAKNHPSAEDIHKRVKKRMPMISLDTIYRTLALFEQCNIISRVHPLDDHCRFDPNTETHHHFICLRCKKVEDFYWPGFDQLSPPSETQQWGVVKSQSVELLGICNQCLKKTAQSEESPQ
jgi:Fur family transcriptional regulator, peroxide stress response regulator